MPRWHILRTLLYKEYLRYSYNWGLLVVVGALLALSALVSISSRLTRVPGLEPTGLRMCHVLYQYGARNEAWVNYLRKQRAPCAVTYTGNSGNLPRPSLSPDAMAVELLAPREGDPNGKEADTWTVRYWHVGPELPPSSLLVRNWLVHATNDFLQVRPRMREETYEAEVLSGRSASERVPLIITALVIFALYLLSFNLYITSTGEEREKRVLLGLLLTPASPLEIIAAKAIFYATASLLVSVAVVAMYQPLLLFNPFLWGAVLCGSLSYVAIGTVVVSLVRRQTTINTVSMLYLIATSIVMILSQFLPGFIVVQLFLVENYLHGLMKLIMAGGPPSWAMLMYLIMLAGATLCWSLVAVGVFTRYGTAIARAR